MWYPQPSVAFEGETLCPRVRLFRFPPSHGVPRAGGAAPEQRTTSHLLLPDPLVLLPARGPLSILFYTTSVQEFRKKKETRRQCFGLNPIPNPLSQASEYSEYRPLSLFWRQHRFLGSSIFLLRNIFKPGSVGKKMTRSSKVYPLFLSPACLFRPFLIFFTEPGIVG